MEFLIRFWFIAFFYSLKLWGGEFTETNLPIRAKGMGGVATIFPRDADAILVNPAYLAYVDSLAWDIVNLGLGVNGVQAYNDFKDIGTASTPSDYANYFGKYLWVEAYGRSVLSVPYFGVAGFNNYHVSLNFDNPVFPDVKVEYLNDVGYMAGVGIPIGTGAFGLAIKRITRTGGSQSVGLSTLAAGSTVSLANTFTDSGVGYGVDIASITRFAGPLNPTITTVWKDVGSTAFTKSSTSTSSPPRIKDNLILGFGTVVDLPGFDWSTGIEYKHAMDQGEPLGKKLHLGMEVSLPIVSLRAGLYQGYLSYGAGLNLFLFELDAAVYSAERGEYPGQKADQRIEASLSLSLELNADFGLNTNGKKRRLKQRR